MSLIKNIVGETAIYGLSSMLGRAVNFLLVPLYTAVLTDTGEYGKVTELYAYVGFLMVIMVYRFETAFFRFGTDKETREQSFSTAVISLLFSSILFAGAITFLSGILAKTLGYQVEESVYIRFFAWILFLDVMAEIPFARLRLENKAFRFASIRLLNIAVNVGLNLFFLLLCPFLIENDPNGSGKWAKLLYNPSFEIGYIFLSNLMASAVSVLFLWPQFKKVQWRFDFSMWKRMGRYALPLVIVGLAGVANEMLDRVLLKWLLPYDLDTNEAQLGIYGACYKLAMIMALFTQAYRYAAEPFFFRHKDHVKAPALYGVITKYFVIAGLFGFLVITLYLDYFQLFLRNPAYREGLNVVPILLIANLMLGVYYNLSVWYKLSDKTHMAAFISMGGAFITLLLNVYWIPRIGYIGSAYATLACYTAMTIGSYFIGRRYYPLRINWTKIILYIALAIILYFVEMNVGRVFLASGAFLNIARLGMIMVFLATVYFLERKELNYWLLVQ